MARKLEDRDPEKAMRILERLADPMRKDSYDKIAADEGVSRMQIVNLRKRNESVIEAHQFQNGSEVPETFEEFLPMLREKAFKALNVSDEDVKKASLAQRGIFAGIAMDKSFILEGRAAMNINVLHEHRHNMDALGEALADALRAKSGELPEFIEAETD